MEPPISFQKKLENKLIESECRNFYNSQSKVSISLSSIDIYALTFIGQYEDYLSKKNKNNIYLEPLRRGQSSLLELEQLGLMKEVMTKKEYNWNFENEYENSTIDCTFVLGEGSFFNLMLEKYHFSSENTLGFIFDFYIQSFVDYFNATKDNFHLISFTSKQESRLNAMKNNNQNLLKALNSIETLKGFTNDSVVIETETPRKKYNNVLLNF